MKKLLYLIFPIVLLGCDDGDIITNDFDFENAAVQRCPSTVVVGSTNDYVFYKNENTNFESLALQFETSEDFLNTEGTYGPFSISSSGSNIFEYRRFNAAPGSAYYCNDIPPSAPRVTEVYTAIGGEIVLVTGIQMDDDGDGVPSADEGIEFNADGTIDMERSDDTDRDGIPDYLDFDDDGDNVPTSLEGISLNSQNNVVGPSLLRDTDGDGTLDYLDADDDDDGILTINESIDGDLNPLNDTPNAATTLPNYLVNGISISANPLIETFNPHTIQRTRKVSISISNLTLTNGSDEIVFETYNFGDYIISTPVTLTCTPDFPPPAPMRSDRCIFQ